MQSVQVQKGFTLIELLVVISIISVLSVIGLVAYSNLLKNSRDVKRQSDLRFIQSALEEYHTDILAYPTTGFVLSSVVTFNSSTGLGSLPAPATTKTYLNAVPKDPTPSTTTPYCYISTLANGSPCDNIDNSTAHRCASYTIYAKLENPPAGPSYNVCGSTYNFQMTPP